MPQLLDLANELLIPIFEHYAQIESFQYVISARKTCRRISVLITHEILAATPIEKLVHSASNAPTQLIRKYPAYHLRQHTLHFRGANPHLPALVNQVVVNLLQNVPDGSDLENICGQYVEGLVLSLASNATLVRRVLCRWLKTDRETVHASFAAQMKAARWDVYDRVACAAAVGDLEEVRQFFIQGGDLLRRAPNDTYLFVSPLIAAITADKTHIVDLFLTEIEANMVYQQALPHDYDKVVLPVWNQIRKALGAAMKAENIQPLLRLLAFVEPHFGDTESMQTIFLIAAEIGWVPGVIAVIDTIKRTVGLDSISILSGFSKAFQAGHSLAVRYMLTEDLVLITPDTTLSDTGKHPLHTAVRCHWPGIVDEFIRFGIDINSPDFSDHIYTGLWASGFRDSSMLDFLLNRGMDLNQAGATIIEDENYLTHLLAGDGLSANYIISTCTFKDMFPDTSLKCMWRSRTLAEIYESKVSHYRKEHPFTRAAEELVTWLSQANRNLG
ncbi:hypothetical protein P171DRAFT_525073 [Karstenula rhodostoma CBS 690.94]|uniref:Ankyrin n=1 Tax=Karstenula rhodostoma CBS 690.94 TaxID=1392251 RepID=A0A9P4PAW4_9PLEO|nr:hypothetical protein P171DRAFT_525073 [Karstenula rhodostoma CBS 690.94]